MNKQPMEVNTEEGVGELDQDLSLDQEGLTEVPLEEAGEETGEAGGEAGGEGEQSPEDIAQLKQENEQLTNLITSLIAGKAGGAGAQEPQGKAGLSASAEPDRSAGLGGQQQKDSVDKYLSDAVVNSLLDGNVEDFRKGVGSFITGEIAKARQEFATTLAQMVPDLIERKSSFDQFRDNNKHLFDTLDKTQEVLNTIQFFTESAPALPYSQILNLTATLLARKYRPDGTVAKSDAAATQGVQKPAAQYAKTPSAGTAPNKPKKGGFVNDYRQSYKDL
ncbi:MAG TPA: hypothetical protein VLH56_08510 [Dissulfurispiraceae bacterium]|nr:hypothetical protein [Dissulfurispiraceae bacterium]